MNVRELIETLEQYDGDAEVLLATQPNWPLQYHVSNVRSRAEMAGDERCDEHDFYNCDECAEEAENVVYIAEGHTPDHPYAPRAAWD